MIQSTIGDLLDGTLDGQDTEGYRLYVVRDGDVVFYVGQSREPTTRLLGHLGRGPWVFYGKSWLGEVITANLPESRAWQVELLTVADCAAFDADDAEQSLINRYLPHLNVKGKRRPSGPWPEGYKTPWAGIANEGVKLE